MTDGQVLGERHGVVLPVRVDRSGITGPTPRAAAGPEWRRTSRGHYVPSYVEPTTAQRIAEVGAVLPERVAVTGWAALSWRGARWFEGLDAQGVPLAVPVVAPTRCLRPQPVMELREERLAEEDLERVDGLLATTPLRSTASVIRHAPDLDTAVAQLEMAYASDLVSAGEVEAWLDERPGLPGIVQGREALALADENSWSPMEWTLRRLWLDRFAGARLLVNRPVFDLTGKHIATPDLIDPETGVTGEYDGAAHHGGARRATELRREGDVRRHGLEPVVMVAPDAHRPAGFWARLDDAYARAARRSASERTWTLEPPYWWRATHSVALRRAIVGPEREVWLGRCGPMFDPDPPHTPAACRGEERQDGQGSWKT